MKTIRDILIVTSVVIGLIGCSNNTKRNDEVNRRISAPTNNSIKLVNQTIFEVHEQGQVIISEFCINGELVAFIDSYKSGGTVKMNNNDICSKYKD